MARATCCLRRASNMTAVSAIRRMGFASHGTSSDAARLQTFESIDDTLHMRVLMRKRPPAALVMREHRRIRLEYEYASIGQQREVDAAVVEVESSADRFDGFPRPFAERGSRVVEKASLLVELPRVPLHIGREVMHHPVRRNRKVIRKRLPVDENRPVFAVVAVC